MENEEILQNCSDIDLETLPEGIRKTVKEAQEKAFTEITAAYIELNEKLDAALKIIEEKSKHLGEQTGLLKQYIESQEENQKWQEKEFEKVEKKLELAKMGQTPKILAAKAKYEFIRRITRQNEELLAKYEAEYNEFPWAEELNRAKAENLRLKVERGIQEYQIGCKTSVEKSHAKVWAQREGIAITELGEAWKFRQDRIDEYKETERVNAQLYTDVAELKDIKRIRDAEKAEEDEKKMLAQAQMPPPTVVFLRKEEKLSDDNAVKMNLNEDYGDCTSASGTSMGSAAFSKPNQLDNLQSTTKPEEECSNDEQEILNMPAMSNKPNIRNVEKVSCDMFSKAYDCSSSMLHPQFSKQTEDYDQEMESDNGQEIVKEKLEHLREKVALLTKVIDSMKQNLKWKEKGSEIKDKKKLKLMKKGRTPKTLEAKEEYEFIDRTTRHNEKLLTKYEAEYNEIPWAKELNRVKAENLRLKVETGIQKYRIGCKKMMEKFHAEIWAKREENAMIELTKAWKFRQERIDEFEGTDRVNAQLRKDIAELKEIKRIQDAEKAEEDKKKMLARAQMPPPTVVFLRNEEKLSDDNADGRSVRSIEINGKMAIE